MSSGDSPKQNPAQHLIASYCFVHLRTMARTTRSSTARIVSLASGKTSEAPLPPRKQTQTGTNRKRGTPRETSPSRKRLKVEPDNASPTSPPPIKDEIAPPVKVEPDTELLPPAKIAVQLSPSKGEALQAKKLKALAQYKKSPFPGFPHPTPEECFRAHKILASLHGERTRPSEVKAPSQRAGCGDSPSVLDALVRTILSQNTSNANSTRAKLSMDAAYGGSDAWERIVAGGQAKLQETIKSGGLSASKSRAILSILEQTKEKYGVYSLDHLFQATNDEAMEELVGFQGVGPKTASCVLLFCLRRDSFAVDTHVWRITGLLGWRPKSATRDETYAHLDAHVPDSEKYGLHILLVTHGRVCEECKAGGKSVGKCELRKAFRGDRSVAEKEE